MAAITAVNFVLFTGFQVFLAMSIHCENWVPVLPALCNSHHIPDLKIDTAYLTVNNDGHLGLTLVLYMQSVECFECDLEAVNMVVDGENCTLLVDTRWAVRMEVRPLNEPFTTPSCSAQNNTHHLLEGGQYTIFTQRTDDGILQCHFVPTISPRDTFIPIYVALGLGLMLPVVWVILKALYRWGVFHRMLCIWSTEHLMSDLGTPIIVNPTEDSTVDSNSGTSQPAKERSERVKSLDTFRGISIVVMIFVNYSGGQYWFFQHSKWNGLTVADLVFPWFVFIMGTALIFSFQGQLRRGMTKRNLLVRIVRRTIILFTLGLVINSLGAENDNGVDLAEFRIPGVLQRFSLTYLVVACVHLIFSRPLVFSQDVRWPVVQDITIFWPEWVIHLVLVAIHLAITFGLSVPGCPRGYLGAGGLAEHGQHLKCTGGAAGHIDRQVFGSTHLDQSPSCMSVYQTVVPYDPEGLLGTLTSIFLCFLGLQAGKIFIHWDWKQRCVRFLLWGTILGLIGGVLCKFSKDDGWIPINKNLWSLSFVLTLGGMAFILLLVLYLLIDVLKVWNGAPFRYPGMNPMVLYVGHELLKGRFPVGFEVPSNHADQLAMDLWGAVFWVIVGYYLHYKGIFITV